MAVGKKKLNENSPKDDSRRRFKFQVSSFLLTLPLILALELPCDPEGEGTICI